MLDKKHSVETIEKIRITAKKEMGGKRKTNSLTNDQKTLIL